MSQIYTIVRIATLVLTGVSLVMSILGLIQIINQYNNDVVAVVASAITIGVMFLGAWGSFKNDRSYLTTFAIILLVAVIVSAFGKIIYTSLGFSLVVIILSLAQAELLRRGH